MQIFFSHTSHTSLSSFKKKSGAPNGSKSVVASVVVAIAGVLLQLLLKRSIKEQFSDIMIWILYVDRIETIFFKNKFKFHVLSNIKHIVS